MSEKKIDFEQTLNQLQSAVQDLEKGQLPLEQALDKFKEAMELAKQCQQALEKAERKISQITEEGQLIEGYEAPPK